MDPNIRAWECRWLFATVLYIVVVFGDHCHDLNGRKSAQSCGGQKALESLPRSTCGTARMNPRPGLGRTGIWQSRSSHAYAYLFAMCSTFWLHSSYVQQWHRYDNASSLNGQNTPSNCPRPRSQVPRAAAPVIRINDTRAHELTPASWSHRLSRPRSPGQCSKTTGGLCLNLTPVFWPPVGRELPWTVPLRVSHGTYTPIGVY